MHQKSFWHDSHYKIIPYSSEADSQLSEFCDSASSEKQKPASANMDWRSIDYILNSEKRFATGEFLLFYVNDRIVAVSGYHQSVEQPGFYNCGVRTFTLKKYEFLGIHSNFLLPHQIRSCWQRNASGVLFFFNDYNQKLFDFMKSLNNFTDLKDIEVSVDQKPEKTFYKGHWQYCISAIFLNAPLSISPGFSAS